MQVLIIGSGIAGLSAAIRSAELGCHVILASPYVSERAQSVMAAGGINAVLDPSREGDSIELHIEDTMKGGCFIEDEDTVRGLCTAAPDIVRWLDSIGVMFSRDPSGNIAQRAFGGQSRDRTAYAGASTGRQIVTALIQKCREYEIVGKIERRIGLNFHSAVIHGGRCCGAVFTETVSGRIVTLPADAVIMAAGGMNRLFGKTTGSSLCDGYAAGRLFTQGVRLRNLEMIQYHPTSIETPNKRMLISEAARGEGGRLYYEEGGRRVYFMEDEFGERGNLMPRDVVSRCMYRCPSQVYLDISFLGEKLIHERLQEVYDVCMDYLGLDVTKEAIPVAPSVHFFMGGIKTDDDHMTDIDGLYAAGECASKYHGANRLGGNSLLAAVYSGRKAAEACSERGEAKGGPDADAVTAEAEAGLAAAKSSDKGTAADSMLMKLSAIMNSRLGIARDEKGLRAGLAEAEELAAEAVRYDEGLSVYENLRIKHMLILSKAMLMSALVREESRGAHYRQDCPETKDEFCSCSVAEYKDGAISISFGDDARSGVKK
ncbi:MAG: FAD-binding protein [Mogibacterium sp.]|nr:FAD-binding protein [Mogibacterium sp.]